jgi:hypothetical protein
LHHSTWRHRFVWTYDRSNLEHSTLWDFFLKENVESIIKWSIIKYCKWFWITLPKNYLTEISLIRKYFTERPFDRNTIGTKTVWPNAIWPKVHLTESPFNRKFIWPKTNFYQKVVWPKIFGKLSTCKTSQMTEMTHDRKFIFDRKLFSKNGHLTKRFSQKIVIWSKVHLTECFFFEKWSFDRMFFFSKMVI